MEDNEGSWGVMAVQFICTITLFLSLSTSKNFLTFICFRYLAVAAAIYDDDESTIRVIEVTDGV